MVSGEFLRQKNIHGDQFGISVLEPGDTSGLIEFLEVGFHVTSVVAGRSSCVFELGSAHFEAFLKSLNMDVKWCMSDLCTDFVADLLSCVPLLLDIDDVTLKKIARNFSILRYEKKQRLFQSDKEATEVSEMGEVSGVAIGVASGASETSAKAERAQ